MILVAFRAATPPRMATGIQIAGARAGRRHNAGAGLRDGLRTRLAGGLPTVARAAPYELFCNIRINYIDRMQQSISLFVRHFSNTDSGIPQLKHPILRF